MPNLTRPSVLEMAVDGKEATMSPTGTPDKSSVSLTGSLSAFSLADVLTLLASTSQTGELHAVSQDVEGWLWLSNGQLANARVGTATTIGRAVFELARIIDGEFSFISGVVSSSGHPTVPVAAVLQEVRPQVDEWRDLLAVVPLDAEVRLAPNPPGPEIRIRNDQWSVLTAVGTIGLSVRSVLEHIGGEQIVGLRTLRDLQSAGLIALVVSGADPHQADRGAGAPVGSPGPGTTPVQPEPGPSQPMGTAAGEAPPGGETAAPQPEPTGTTEATRLPPPLTVDPWAPPSDTEGAGGNGLA